MTLPALSTLARRVLAEAGLERGAVVLVACSGGVDSQVLLDVLAHIARPARGKRKTAPPAFRLVACGVDHGLRAEAKDELALAEELARARGVAFSSVRVQVAPGSNLQARAREARFAALRRVAAEVGASFIATGHHQGDKAETVLIRILRGAPAPGLAVLPPVSKELIRPLIRATRAQIEAHARRRGLAFAHDPSNVDRRHLRVRVREEVVPLLRSLDPRIEEHLAALADSAVSIAGPRDEHLGGTEPGSGQAGARSVAHDVGTEQGRSTSQRARRSGHDRHGRAEGRVLHPESCLNSDASFAPTLHSDGPPDDRHPERHAEVAASSRFDGRGVRATRNSRAPLVARLSSWNRRVAPVKRQP
ncbi:MAG: tRNA lysidine(34) synthetase TilS [Deltaproteobacteria bacterium]|nr:tRNA lysidine(34) synthetase TilS [Deltaproteobacteria bacterium]